MARKTRKEYLIENRPEHKEIEEHIRETVSWMRDEVSNWLDELERSDTVSEQQVLRTGVATFMKFAPGDATVYSGYIHTHFVSGKQDGHELLFGPADCVAGPFIVREQELADFFGYITGLISDNRAFKTYLDLRTAVINSRYVGRATEKLGDHDEWTAFVGLVFAGTMLLRDWGKNYFSLVELVADNKLEETAVLSLHFANEIAKHLIEN